MKAMGKSGVMYLTFTNPEPNVLNFVTEERVRGWQFESNLTFSPMGREACICLRNIKKGECMGESIVFMSSLDSKNM